MLSNCRWCRKYKGKYKYDYLNMLKNLKTNTSKVIELYGSDDQKKDISKA